MKWFRVSDTRWIYGNDLVSPCAAEIVQGPDGFTAALTGKHSPGELLGLFTSFGDAQTAIQGRL